MIWQEKALASLHKSLTPVPQELNALDWKGNLSKKTDRLAQHICAFANLAGGGLVGGASLKADFGKIVNYNK